MIIGLQSLTTNSLSFFYHYRSFVMDEDFGLDLFRQFVKQALRWLWNSSISRHFLKKSWILLDQLLQYSNCQDFEPSLL